VVRPYLIWTGGSYSKRGANSWRGDTSKYYDIPRIKLIDLTDPDCGYMLAGVGAAGIYPHLYPTLL